ncbi:hypothetical protein Golax_025526 [Gossypium laxum]|uniref:Uncharacterized protein n=1 Tax=Gossypium laxum TaxID=34288 RepID=A0A7J9B033_9ROSI|nr:hypothetical protein [Gossypium laxum]
MPDALQAWLLTYAVAYRLMVSLYSTSEDEANIQNEEASEDYGRLEHDYQKFLSECGISKWGYWRGGSPGA